MVEAEKPRLTPIPRIAGVRIFAPDFDPTRQYDISIVEGTINSIELHDPHKIDAGDTATGVLDACNGGILTSSLCHAHIHLDKAFLMSDAKFSNLMVESGGFEEAMSLGKRAKERFERDDLLRRGKWLISESIAAGVTHMRTFVEVDSTVQFKCLEAAIELKKFFTGCIRMQICAFAQDALFSGESAEQNVEIFHSAIHRTEVEVIGSTPYIEETEEKAKLNLHYTMNMARSLDKHVDLHLDYNLDPEKPVLTHYAMDVVERIDWGRHKTDKTIVLGHCTRLTMFSSQEWQNLSEMIKWNDCPISLIGLPSSDLFIQGKAPEGSGGGERLRGTLQIPQLIRQYGFNAAIAVNNVGNAFTPHGTCDLLALASFGIGIYQAGTKADVECLFDCVSRRAKAAIGLEGNEGFRSSTLIGPKTKTKPV